MLSHNHRPWPNCWPPLYVVFGPDGFSALPVLYFVGEVCSCRHTVVALVAHLRRGGDSKCYLINPRRCLCAANGVQIFSGLLRLTLNVNLVELCEPLASLRTKYPGASDVDQAVRSTHFRDRHLCTKHAPPKTPGLRRRWFRIRIMSRKYPPRQSISKRHHRPGGRHFSFQWPWQIRACVQLTSGRSMSRALGTK